MGKPGKVITTYQDRIQVADYPEGREAAGNVLATVSAAVDVDELLAEHAGVTAVEAGDDSAAAVDLAAKVNAARKSRPATAKS